MSENRPAHGRGSRRVPPVARPAGNPLWRFARASGSLFIQQREATVLVVALAAVGLLRLSTQPGLPDTYQPVQPAVRLRGPVHDHRASAR